MSASEDTAQAARVVGPVAAADSTWRTGVYRVAFTGSSQTITLPTTGKVQGKESTLGARFIRILAMGANAQYALVPAGTSTPTLTLNAVISGGNPVVTAGATLPNGVPDQFMVPSDITRLVVIGDNSNTGYLEFYCSDQPVV